jgi:hypothetical protein
MQLYLLRNSKIHVQVSVLMNYEQALCKTYKGDETVNTICIPFYSCWGLMFFIIFFYVMQYDALAQHKYKIQCVTADWNLSNFAVKLRH